MYYSIALGTIIVASIVSAVGGAVYFVWDLAWPGVVFTLAISAIISTAVLKYIFEIKASIDSPEDDQSKIWALGLIPFFAGLTVCFTLLWRGQTDMAINSPWLLVPQLFWVAVALTATSAAVIFQKAKGGIIAIAVAGLIGLTVSIAILLYKIGYGYDPLIHQAAEQHIIQFGSILPKTPYYAGQYALTVIISRLTTFSIHTVDVWLLPILAIIGIAGTTILAAKAQKRSSGYLAAGLIIILPLAALVNTTPFSLACLFALFASIVGLAAKDYPRLKLVVWVFAVAALITHPIAGVPTLILAGLIQFKKNMARILIAVIGALGVPILFALIGAGFSFSLARLGDLSLPFVIPLTRFHALGDMVYFIGAVVAVSIIISLVTNRIYLLATAATIVSGFIIAISIDFSYLPDHEQSGYANRLFVVAMIIAVPAAAMAISKLFERTAKNPWRSFSLIALIAFFFTGGLYLAFPRVDAYALSKGWNTSETNIETVHKIADDAGSEPYIVLAGQPVSAAALREFGFFKYYDTAQGQVFAYNIPTGGPLYQFYLEMFYNDPTAETMNQAMELTGVKQGYFVVSSYWTGSDHVIARAKLSSEKNFSINTQDTVFKYSR